MKAQHLMCDNRKLWANTSLHVTSHIFIKLFQEKKEKKKKHLSPLPALCSEKKMRGQKNNSEHHLLAHHLLNHQYKATQLKSGSFRVTVDGVPEALEVFA